jgi:lipoyl(octanoyl) transferase
MQSLDQHASATEHLSTTGSWSFFLTPPLSGVANMAIDAAMLDRARAQGVTIVRVYSWSRPTLSLGRNQSAQGLYDFQRIRERDIDVVRRPTGGRAILHWREVTYSVAAPIDAGESLRASYARINLLLLQALQAVGAAAELAGSTQRETHPGLAPCFDHPSSGELVAGGKKLVGSAQWRESGAYLQHGSILVDDDQTSIVHLLQTPVAAPPIPATLRELTGRVILAEEIAEHLRAAIERGLGRPPSQISVTDLEPESSRWVRHFSDEQWTWRR